MSSSPSASYSVAGNIPDNEKRQTSIAWARIVGESTFGAEFGKKLRLIKVGRSEEPEESCRGTITNAIMEVDVDSGMLSPPTKRGS